MIEEALARRLIMLGETHGDPACIELMQDIQRNWVQQKSSGKLHVVLEHFSFPMQREVLDPFQEDGTSAEELLRKYAEIGTEGHDLQPYMPAFLHAQANSGRIKLHAGFPPRTLARTLMKEGVDAALPEAVALDYLAAGETLDGTEQHYNAVEAMITGRDLHDPSQPPTERFRKLFKAQLLKDAAMAHRVNTLIAGSPAEDAFLVVCGSGHMVYGHGDTTAHVR